MNKDKTKSTNSSSATHDGTYPQDMLKDELLSLAVNRIGKYDVPAAILQSDTYCRLQEKIEKRKVIQDSDPFWEEIEKTVFLCSPDFRRKLNLLTYGHLTIIDYHTALLLKCGIKPSLMTIVTGRSQGSIVSRRETLGRKILGKKMGLAISDCVIQLL